MEVDVSLSGCGLQFVGKVTLFQATQIMAFISKPTLTVMSEGRAEQVDLMSVPEPQKLVAINDGRYESPREAIDSLHAKTNGQKIVAISLYLGANSQNDKILLHSEVLSEFSRAGEATPKYFKRDLKDAISAGYIYSVDDKSLRLLSPADNISELGFKKKNRKKRTFSKVPDGENASKLSVRSDVSNLNLDTNLEGYIDYFSTSTRADQILWILLYAKASNIIGLNRLEIINISSKLGGDIDSKGYASSNVSNIRNGYVSSSGQILSVTIKGELYFSKLKSKNKN